MESKRAEACRFKQIAEEKFRDRDINGCNINALKAYDLCPNLEGISEMITAVQILLVAKGKLPSKLVDWYAILQVNESSHPILIKKQYRELSSLLHPHIKKSPVAEAAFKLIQEAWSVLSNKSKKYKYDRMRKGLITEEHQGSEPGPSDLNTSFSSPQASSVDTQMDSLKAQNVDFPNGAVSSVVSPGDSLKKSSHDQSFMDTHMTSGKTPNVVPSNGGDSVAPANMASGKCKSGNSTFWTACPFCYSVQDCPPFLKRQILVCPVCHSTFQALEVMTMSINDIIKRSRKGSDAENYGAIIENEVNSSEDNKAEDVTVNQPKEAVEVGTMHVNDYTGRARTRSNGENVPAMIENEVNSCQDEKAQDKKRTRKGSKENKVGVITENEINPCEDSKAQDKKRTRKGSKENNVGATTENEINPCEDNKAQGKKRTMKGSNEENFGAMIENEVNSSEDNKAENVTVNQPKEAVEVGTMHVNDYTKRARTRSNGENIPAVIENEINSCQDNNAQDKKRTRKGSKENKVGAITENEINLCEDSKAQDKKRTRKGSKENKAGAITENEISLCEDNKAQDKKRTRKENKVGAMIENETNSCEDQKAQDKKRTRQGNKENKVGAMMESEIISCEDNKAQDKKRTRRGNVENKVDAIIENEINSCKDNKAQDKMRTSQGNKENKVAVMIENVINSHEDNKAKDVRRKQAVDQPKKAKSRTKKVKNESRKQNKSVSCPSKEGPSVEQVLMDVQDSDFYDFDQDRVENCFEANQIWAIYDDHDGMPRYYARINEVLSLHPFKVTMTWLEGKDNGDECLARWANAGFCRSCGEFSEGISCGSESLNVFSHLMKGEKAAAGIFKIFPRRGSIWALYRNWQTDWDESTPNEVTWKYDIVLIMTDFIETMGVSVVPLVKLDGFKSVYHRAQMGSKTVKWVPRTEILKFSHQVPARIILGNEAQNLPKGCWELDPAASPLD